MSVYRSGTGFSEEPNPFAAEEPATTSRKIILDRNNPFGFDNRELAETGFVRMQYEAFYAIHALWLRRRAEGMTQKDIAEKLGRDPAWVSRALSGPKNWTMRTMGELAHALDGRVTIRVEAAEDLSAEGRSTEAG